MMHLLILGPRNSPTGLISFSGRASYYLKLCSQDTYATFSAAMWSPEFKFFFARLK